MSRSDIARYLADMAENMALHGRTFTYEMPEGAAVERLKEKTDGTAVLELPTTLREFLQEADGLACASVASNKSPEILNVPSLAQVIEYSTNINRGMVDMRDGLVEKDTIYIVCGLYLDDTFVIRRGEQAVLLYDVWVAEDDWLSVASSFEEWLTRSFDSMANTANGFRYFQPIHQLW